MTERQNLNAIEYFVIKQTKCVLNNGVISLDLGDCDGGTVVKTEN